MTSRDDTAANEEDPQARTVRLYWALPLAIFLTSLLLSAAYVATRWNNYTAESRVYVQPLPSGPLESAPGQQQEPRDANAFDTYIQQQIHNATRADVLAGAVRRIDGLKGENAQAEAGRLGGNLEVARVGTGHEISINVTAASANKAAKTANAVAASFIESAAGELRSRAAQQLEQLRDQRRQVLKDLASDRTEQETLNNQLGAAAAESSAPDKYADQIAAIRAELVKAQTDSDQASAKLTATTEGPSSAALDAEADQIVAADPRLMSSKTELNKRRLDLISQMANLSASNPLYQQDTDELAKVNDSLDAMTRDLRAKAAARIGQKVKTDLERTSAVEARLNGQLAKITGAAGRPTPRMQRANQLATDIARLQARFTTVDGQIRTLSMENPAPDAVYLSAPAVAPLHADHGKIYRNALAILLAGMVLALAAALIVHKPRQRQYVAANDEQTLGVGSMALLADLHEAADKDATVVAGPAKPGEPRKESAPAAPSVPAQPSREREAGSRFSVPYTGEEGPYSWRARLRAEKEALFPILPPAERAGAADGSERQPVASRRKEPLKEWWDELAPPAEHPGADQAHAAPVSTQDAAPSPAQPVAEQNENPTVSRLSGLRNLLVSQGIQNLHRKMEQRRQVAAREPRMETLPESDIIVQSMEPDENDDSWPAPMEVTGHPELNPLLFNPEPAERDEEPKTPAQPPPINRWDGPDDIDILPSQRGQYRPRH
ncbi:MAG TPA: hypothetical protein VG267_11615 [Terracidiphilus sp.]|jgi:uncharacterized protein involved in exopolysaccharide biosynthesis|nr:hypothetical protein [Terracidiphilus sp.]